MTLGGLLENIIADVIFLTGITICATVLLATTRWRTQARLLRFLGLQTDKPLLVVFFSTLVVRQGGSTGFDGVRRTYSGPAVPEAEWKEGQIVSRALEVPGRGLLARLLMTAIRRIPWDRVRDWLGPQEVEIQYELSYLQVPAPLPAAVTICLGSPGYNYATDVYLSTLSPLLTFSGGPNPDIRDESGNPVTHDGDVGMLQRLRRDDGLPVYIAAGLGTNGTRGALQRLFTAWRDLEKRFGTGDFALALGFPWFRDDPFGSQRPVELLALSRQTGAVASLQDHQCG
jgi:hypothetical protein